MQPKELFDAGDLSGAINAQTEEVKANPGDLARRAFLFELLSFAGQFDRAGKQLEVIAHQDVQSGWATQVYVNLLHAESLRSRLFSDGLKPEFLLDPPAYVGLHLQAINRLREKQAGQAKALLDESEDSRPTPRGDSGGKHFDEFRDCDDVLAPILELFIIRDYVWLPLEQVRELEISRPERPRDLLWAPVRVVLIDGSQRRGYMPTLYCGTHQHPDNQIKLGRMTDWRSSPDGPVEGIGMKQFLIGEDALTALELPTINFKVPVSGIDA